MANIPLHPAVVHFPIVLSFLLPIFALGSIWAIRRGARPLRAWAVPLAIAVLLLVSAFAATRTGESEEERVEEVVPENVIHAHEAAAERFLVLTGIVVLIGIAGLMPGVSGSAGRYVATVGSLVIVFAGFQVGKAGGELVYRHNAARVYALSSPDAGGQPNSRVDDDRATEDHDD